MAARTAYAYSPQKAQRELEDLQFELKARNGKGTAAVPEWMKVRLRTIVDDLGLTTTVELLSEIETEMQCEALDIE